MCPLLNFQVAFAARPVALVFIGVVSVSFGIGFATILFMTAMFVYGGVHPKAKHEHPPCVPTDMTLPAAFDMTLPAAFDMTLLASFDMALLAAFDILPLPEAFDMTSLAAFDILSLPPVCAQELCE